MAHVIGTSGAWKQVAESLADLEMSFSHPRDIKAAFDEFKACYHRKVAHLSVQLEDEIAGLSDELPKLIDATQDRIRSESNLVAAQSARLDARNAQLRTQGGLLCRLGNWFRMRAAERLKRTLQRDLRRLVDSENQRVVELQQRIAFMVQRKPDIVEQRKARFDMTIARLESVLTSSELAGAQAELQVAEILSKLPSDCWVFHDVRLQADHFMRFEGIPLESAQADHVVLTRSGVFIIEVKNWSQGFVETRDYFDPYTQVGRARFLCSVLLRDRGLDTKVRSIIAACGRLPEKRSDQYVKVLRPDELNGYILWFKENSMPADELNAIRNLLQARVS